MLIIEWKYKSNISDLHLEQLMSCSVHTHTPSVLEPDLHLRLAEADSAGDLISKEHVRIVRVLEHLLERMQLRAVDQTTRALYPYISSCYARIG